jgi:pyridoxal phosphate enzyme (YggS family)
MNEIQYKIYIDDVIRRVEKARLMVSPHHIVKIVAISKYSTSDEIQKLYNIGQRAFGENKVQDLKQKQQELKDLPIAWHFVGRLQKNKINNLIDCNPVLMHSLDSLELAYELDKKLKIKNKTMNCLLQINSANEPSKAGVSIQKANEIYTIIKNQCSSINLKGVMSIGTHTTDLQQIKQSFKETKKIFDSLSDATICSMGMSGDFELAIANGSTMVRIGSKLFKQ